MPNNAGEGDAGSPPQVPPELLAEASVWVARLHGPGRDRRMELDCLAWQARSAAHRLAFERCTEVWQMVPNLPSAQAYAALAKARRKGEPPAQAHRQPHRAWALGGLALAGLATAALLWLQPWQAGQTYATDFAEQRHVLLADGSRLWLNTETRLRVRLTPQARTVAVQAGEAVFEVAPDTQRPFVVRVAASEVVALGTVFSVRLTAGQPAQQALAVAVLQGQVAVRPTPQADEGLAPAAAMVMQPGERVRLQAGPSPAAAATAQVDRPPMEQLVAWRRNEAVFEDVSLAEAVAEMNRYSRTRIVLSAEAAASHKRISGQFRTGDNAAFAQAVAALHGLAVQQAPGRLELVLPP